MQAAIETLPTPNWLILLPFGILLLAIALGPVVARHHWGRHYHRLCVVLAAIVCGYYVLGLGRVTPVAHAVRDYFSFMVVVGASFVVSGGIHLRVPAPSGPFKNTAFLFGGAVLANLVGTIGASMLLIRPWINMNKGRLAPLHIVFFIFLIR